MKRLRDTWTIIEFALRSIGYLWIEPKMTVSWERYGKQITFRVNFYNHLSDDEIEKSKL